MDHLISLTTDFGIGDSSVGQCKGVIASISPRATVIDLTHAIPHFDIQTGAIVLRNAVTHFPACVHVAVVDPGVGTSRRAIAVACKRGDTLVGPDNGLLLPAAEALGGAASAVELTKPEFHHRPVSNTFHARDIFSPVAAHIVHGVAVHLLGPTLELAELVQLSLPVAQLRDGTLHGAVVTINEYGTLALNASGTALDDLGNPSRVRATVGEQQFEARVTRTFGEVGRGEALLFVDSYGQLSLSRNLGDLAASLGLARTDRPAVTISPAPEGNQ